MKYYEFKEPYYALISAESQSKAREIYNNEACEIDNNVEAKEMTKDDAIKRWGSLGYKLFDLVDLMQEEGMIILDGALR